MGQRFYIGTIGSRGIERVDGPMSAGQCADFFERIALVVLQQWTEEGRPAPATPYVPIQGYVLLPCPEPLEIGPLLHPTIRAKIPALDRRKAQDVRTHNEEGIPFTERRKANGETQTPTTDTPQDQDGPLPEAPSQITECPPAQLFPQAGELVRCPHCGAAFHECPICQQSW